MNSTLFVTEIEFATPAYDMAIRLRDEVLRKPLGLEFTVEELSTEFDSHHLACYSLNNEELLGILVLKPVDNQVIKMRQVAIVPTLQSKGIGSLLVSFSEKFAKSKAYNKIELHARDTAVDFYKKLGYKIEGEEFLEVSIPHYKMVKSL